MASISEYLEIIVGGKDLDYEQAKKLLDRIFEGEVPEVQVAAFLTALRVKGVVADELAGLAKSLRNHAVKVVTGNDYLIDIVGTGGSGKKTFNISTAAAFVAAGAGLHVAKHGNRGITSKCGSADVLAELGVNIEASPEVIAKCISGAGVGFMFAPKFHLATKYVQPIRKSLGFGTVFNVLGPLANPADAKGLVIGVADESLMGMIAETMARLGSERVMVVNSDGLDEIGISGCTKIVEYTGTQKKEFSITPEEFGMTRCDNDDIKGDGRAENAKIIRDILSGKERGGRRDVVLLNAAAGMIVGKLVDDFDKAITIARDSIDSGKAMESLEKLIVISNS
ncbi:MAG: anthranilate phosphoribosyltransferase [Phycisphaerae bacterium]|nr:anthranilate phosphoribosyltransferase [Phycisphaerae bacterium]